MALLPSARKSLLPECHLFRSDEFLAPKSSISIPNWGCKRPPIRASSATVGFPLTAREKVGVLSDNLDGWMRESVVEIVKSLKNSPLMLHVYCKDLEKQWRDVERRSPDGIILVQQLHEEDNNNNTELGGTKAWGVLLIQGTQCSRTACYLLKTCTVHSGLGLCATHFSLVQSDATSIIHAFRQLVTDSQPLTKHLITLQIPTSPASPAPAPIDLPNKELYGTNLNMEPVVTQTCDRIFKTCHLKNVAACLD